MADADTVTVVVCPAPRITLAAIVPWRADLSLAQALVESGLQARCDTLDLSACEVGIWGRLASHTDLLRTGDRVEVYRRLTVDPKEARRLRYRAQKPKRKLIQPRRPRPAS